jgi:hypothetical protein
MNADGPKGGKSNGSFVIYATTVMMPSAVVPAMNTKTTTMIRLFPMLLSKYQSCSLEKNATHRKRRLRWGPND